MPRRTRAADVAAAAWSDAEHPSWLYFGARMGDYVRHISGRDDLRVRIAPNPDGPSLPDDRKAIAYFVPDFAAITINAARVLPTGTDPNQVDLIDYRHQARYPVLTGVTVHECAHTVHTTVSFPASVSANDANWALVLEESRCEKKALQRRPQDAIYLTASTETLIISSFDNSYEQQQTDESARRHDAGRIAALVLARVDSGVLEASSVQNVADSVRRVLGQSTMDAIQGIWRRAQELADGDVDGLITCAKDYQAALSLTQDDEPSSGNSQMPQDSQSSGGSQNGNSPSSASASGSDSEESGTGNNSSEDGSTESGSTESGSTESGSTESGSTESGSAEGSSSQDGSSQDGSTESGSTEGSSAEGSSSQDGSSQDGSSQDGSSEGSSPEGSSSADDSSADDSSESNSSQGGSSESGSSDNDSSQGESTESGSSQNGTTASSQPQQNIARQLPCGAWTPGSVSEDTQVGNLNGQGSSTQVSNAAIADMIAASQNAAVQVAIEAGINPPSSPANAERQAEETARQEAQAAAATVFVGTGNGIGTGIVGYYRAQQVTPDGNTLNLSRRLQQSISRAQFRDVTRTRIASATPPGRMRAGLIAQREAQVAGNLEITATPWSEIRRRSVQAPPLTMGIATDISGSMEPWQEPVAKFSWALAKAVRDLKGDVASVSWNGTPAALIAPRRFPMTIPVPRCNGMSSGCPSAIKALDGALNLAGGQGARVLAVVTDGELPNLADIQGKITRLTKAGVIVLWILTRNSPHRQMQDADNIYLSSPDDFATVVTRKVTEALEKAEMRKVS